MVGFHLPGYRMFKHCYLNQVLRNEPSYYRFVELLQGNAGAVELFSDQPFWALQWDELH
ncbi:hypothetical protein SAMN05421754_108310 [Nitrosomonas sp. Nm58]|nr:hypothetical protein SAMN05421754_108310 [Nitrosomonas sp. Nm58]